MSQAAEGTTRTEVRDGMRITWHQSIAMGDGIVLSADVFRPIADARAPVILTYAVRGESRACDHAATNAE